jgi:hypothetical protein
MRTWCSAPCKLMGTCAGQCAWRCGVYSKRTRVHDHTLQPTVVQPEVVAGLQIHRHGTGGEGLQVHCQNLQGHVVVVQLQGGGKAVGAGQDA